MVIPNRRDLVLEQCIAEGRIVQASRAGWAARYDQDPTGTEQVLAMLTPVPSGVLSRDPIEAAAEAGIALLRGQQRAFAAEPMVVQAPVARQRVQARLVEPPPSSLGVGITPDVVKAWTREMFPETAASGEPGRIMSDEPHRRRGA